MDDSATHLAAEPLSAPRRRETREETIARVVRDAVLERRTPLHALDRDDRIAIIRELDQAGVFAVRRAADVVARELAISRASVYTYLRAARGD